MAAQQVISNGASAKRCAAITLAQDFHIQSVDHKLKPEAEAKKEATAAAPPLGVLSYFKGTWTGNGFNLIFRPNSGPPTTTTFPKPITPAAPTPPSENVLELNLTAETLTFSNTLGSIPNRGLEGQNDIFLNGVPYVQSINDVSNTATGKADGTAVGINFEPSLSRMASIPHGTTINAEGLAPTSSTPGAPNIPSVRITPFAIGNPSGTVKFTSQTATDINTPRLPQDLSKFIAAGTITQAILDDPNTVLRNANKGKTITNTTTFTVSTSPSAPELGGGTANIAFLQGTPSTNGPNANAVQMSSTFWISTVEHKITVPERKAGESIKIAAPANQPGAKVPVFEVVPPHDIPHPTVITVTSTQIQYSQLVFLNFANLTWPHVSVATLVPSAPQAVPAAAWKSAVM